MEVNSRLRVLHVLHAYRPGGMENMIAQMAWRLDYDKFEIAICALTRSDSFKERLPSGTQIFELNKSPGLSFTCIFNLRKLINKYNPDVVHAHNWDGLIYSWLALAGTSRVILQGEHAQLYQWERSKWRLNLRRALYSRCSLVHTVSNGQAAELTDLGLAKNVDLKVIQNGVDTERFAPVDKDTCRTGFGISKNAFCLGMVARCIADKRHHFLLDAFNELAPDFPELMLVLAGAGGDCEKQILGLVKSHPYKERIHWLGHRNDMPLVYNLFDLFVLPSITEGMSNVCLEAMSSGVAGLVHEACGVDEIIQDGYNGFVRAMHTPQDLINSLRELIPNFAGLKMVGLNARSTAVKSYPLSRVERDYADVYRKLAGRSNKLTL